MRTKQRTNKTRDATPTLEITQLRTLSEIATAYRVTRECVRKWITRGVRPGRGQPPVKLRAQWFAGRWHTQPDWVEQFNAAVTQGRTHYAPDWDAEQRKAAEMLGG